MKKFSLIVCFILIGCIEQKPIALGTLERQQINFPTTTNEIIVALPFARGSRIKKGDVLVRLDNRQLNLQVLQSKAEVMKIQSILTKLTKGARAEDIAVAEAKVNQQMVQLSQAKTNYLRIADLYKKQLISQVERDKANTNLKIITASLKQATEDYKKVISGARVEDVNRVRAELRAAKLAQQLAQTKLDNTIITATRSGILEGLPFQVGERVPLGANVAILLADDIPYAKVYVPATYRMQLTVGTQVDVSIDGVDTKLTGTIRHVANKPSFSPYYNLTEHERSHLMYVAEVTLPNRAFSFPSGIPVQVSLKLDASTKKLPMSRSFFTIPSPSSTNTTSTQDKEI
ncbi:MAG: HlyD family secretion protein [Parashewanella sp.]